MKTPGLILFAKAPVAGQVKTRLQPICSPEESARIARLLIETTVSLVADSWPGEVALYAWPDTQHDCFQELARAYHLRLAVQAPGDLGQKILSALKESIARHGAAAVMGCDVPHCSGDILEQAYEHLAKGRPVVGPSMDGGYYLLGLTDAQPGLFQGVEWGGEQVLSQTLINAARLSLTFERLPLLRDIDTWEDLCVVASHFAPLGRVVTLPKKINIPIAKKPNT